METNLYEISDKCVNQSKFCLKLIVIEICLIIICKFIFCINKIPPFIIIVLFFISFLIIGVFVVNIISTFRIRKLNKIEYLKTDLCEKIIYYPNGCLLTKHHLIIEFNKRKIINYNDVTLLHIRNTWYNGAYRIHLLIVLKTGKQYSILIDDDFLREHNLTTDDILNFLIIKNNNILIGKTKENQKFLLEKYNIKI